MISQETIELVKAKSQILDVVQDHVKMKKQGVNYTGLCPFHAEKSASFTVNQAKGIYKCFGCGKSGDAIQFIIDVEQKTYVEAIETLAKKYNVEIEDNGPRKEYVKPVQRLEKLDKKRIQWFEETRKISNDTLLRLKITESSEWMPQFEKEKEVPVICFNYFKDGELTNIKFRGPKKSFKLSKDAELIFYNIDAIKGEEEGIIVEGEIDTATLIECGIYNVVGVPNGTPPKNSKMNLEYLNNCWEDFSKLKTVIIAVDNDEVGKYLKEELGRRIGKEKCKVVTYPEGCKDPNDILVKMGKQAVKDFIYSAKYWPIEGLVPMEEQFDELMTYYEEGYPIGLKSGMDGMDDLLSFYPGHLTMITGVPGHGKDEVANELMVDLSKSHQMVWAVFNFEEPPTIHSTKLVEKHAKKAFAFRKNPVDRLTKNQLEKAIVFVEQHFHQVNISQIDVTMEGIIKKAIELVMRYGVNGMIINPWNYLEHKLGPGQNETHYVSEALTMLINFLWKYGVHCFLVAHPAKVQKDKKTGKYEVPTLYSISGSAHFFNKTHNGICVYRHYDSNITEVYVQKVKWYWLGQIGWVAYNFDVNTRQYNFHSTSVVKKHEDTGLPGNFKPVQLAVSYLNNVDEEEAEKDDLPF